jgi:hypothetical protein
MEGLVGAERIRVVRRLMERDGAACTWCDRPLKAEPATSRVDLVVRRSAGGQDQDVNRVVACEPCERLRGPRDASWWLLGCAGYRRTRAVDIVEARLRDILASTIVDDERDGRLIRQAARDLRHVDKLYGRMPGGQRFGRQGQVA